MSSTDSRSSQAPEVAQPFRLSEVGSLLPSLARRSVTHYLTHETTLQVDTGLPSPLCDPAAVFVSLHDTDKELRGCIGTLTAGLPLAEGVATFAVRAATEDPRFDPLERRELPRVIFSVSVLGDPEPLKVESEAQLVERLNPGEDGLTLYDGAQRGTFLPSVWEKLPDPAEFVRELKRKAGLDPDAWSETLRVERYRVATFAEIEPDN